VIFDAVGDRPLRTLTPLLDPKGTYVPVGAPEGGRWFGPIGPLLAVMLQAPFVKPRVAAFTGTPKRVDLEALHTLVEAGELTPAICREFELADVPEAMRFLAHDRPPSKVVIRVRDD